MFWQLMGTVFAGLIGLAFFLYFWIKGQFDECEDVKYQLFRDE